MKLEDVKNLKWIPVTDWNGLTTTDFNKGNAFVTDDDVENFVDNIFRDVSRKLDIPFNDLITILRSENASFYEVKERLFEKYNFSIDSDSLLQLQKLLRVPDVDSVPMVPKIGTRTSTNAEKVLEEFSLLSEIEKLQVLKELSLLTVKVEFNP